MKSERRRRRKKGTVKSKVGIKREARYFYIPGHRNSICSGVFFLPLSLSLITKTSARNEERFLSRIPIERLFGSFAVLEKALLSSPLVLNYLERSR